MKPQRVKPSPLAVLINTYLVRRREPLQPEPLLQEHFPLLISSCVLLLPMTHSPSSFQAILLCFPQTK